MTLTLDLGSEWEKDADLLRERLRLNGIFCRDLENREKYTQLIPEPALFRKQETVVLTDSVEFGKRLAQNGIVYFGCQRGESAWFDGAVLVLEGFEDVDASYLEEWMCRTQGRPVRIAETERLLIREIGRKDLDELVRIGKLEDGLALLEEDAFTADRLLSYCVTAYRLQGYGLWSVLNEGKVIGCCGFAPLGEHVSPEQQKEAGKDIQRSWTNEKNQEQVWIYHLRHGEDHSGLAGEEREGIFPALELQYMLDVPYRRQGFGAEMCRAVLQYAYERLDVNEIWLRIRPDNLASQALARKLGFYRRSLLWFPDK